MKLSYEPYKEPLREVEGGFGYMGVLAKTDDGASLQCHICGGLYGHLGIHAMKTHGLNAAQYRAQFELMGKTRLISPDVRTKYIAAYAASPPELKALRLRAMANGRRRRRGREGYVFKKTLEQRNIEGNCPDQIIDKIRKLALEKGETPSLREFRKHYHGLVRTTYDTFGSWSNALEIAQLKKNRIGLAPIYTRDNLLLMLVLFKKRHGRRPYTSDLRGGDLPSAWTFTKYFGSFSNAVAEMEKEQNG